LSESRAQFSISDSSTVPFVAGIIPVVGGNGQVGGVSVDAKGVVSRAKLDKGDLVAARNALLAGAPRTKLRVISLARLEQSFAEHFKNKKIIPEEMLYLAGLQRIEYVLAIPERHDILLAGPAERWQVEERSGAAIGTTTGRPAMRLDDLLEAFRTAQTAAEGTGISCSIDPSQEGLERLQKRLRDGNLRFNARTTEILRQAVGPQKITIHGVFPDSHFARVMVAADYMMKRLAMGLEESPVEDMPNYLELLKSNDRPFTGMASPRWWLAVNYLPLLHTADDLSWQIRGPGVKVLTEDVYIDSSGGRAASGETDEVAERWANTMTKNFDDLSVAMPIFAELRNCMDLAVTAALVSQYDLIQRVGAKLPLIAEGRGARGPVYEVPATVDSHISVARSAKSWIVGVSGGVDVDSWSVLAKPQESATPLLTLNIPADRWWWDSE